MLDTSFFFLDSNNLCHAESKLCGYMLVQDSIIKDLDQISVGEFELNAYGCYTLIYRKDDIITISQDYNGSFGLYLFCKEGQ